MHRSWPLPDRIFLFPRFEYATIWEQTTKKKEPVPRQKTTENYQDIFLDQARRERTMLTVFLMNGFQMRGVITGFDQFVILLQSDGRQQMIYKHAVSTMTPAVPVHLTQN